MSDSVPVIDIRQLDSPAVRAAIHEACRDWGFFQVTGHGIEQGVIDEIFAVSHAFFEQSAADKRRLLRDAENPWGYFDQELTKNRLDCKEIYDFGPTAATDAGRAGRTACCASVSSRPCAPAMQAAKRCRCACCR